MDRVVWGYEVAENSYKTEAIGEKLCGKKGRGGWILSRNVRGGSVKIFGGGGGGGRPPLAMSHEGGWKKIKYPLLGVHVERFSLDASRCFVFLFQLVDINVWIYRCVSKDNTYMYAWNKGTR